MDKKLIAFFNSATIIAIVPAFFVFYGFIYLYFYMDYFDLSVSDHYDASEILLLFLPIIDILVNLGIMLMLLWGLLFFFNRVYGKRRLFYLRPKWFFIFIDKTLRDRYRRINKTKRVVLLAIFRILYNSTTIFTCAFLITSNYIKQQSHIDIMAVAIFGIIAVFWLYDIVRLYNKFFPVLTGMPRIPIKTFMAVVCLLSFYGFTKNLAIVEAQYTIQKKHFVSFKYDGARHSTGADTVCVLRSRKVFVFRCLKNSKNRFFEKEKISGLETMKAH